ncbi:ChaN family lipoprotein [Flavobacterium sp. F372]|uniref:ChaN family lipoprotein n=1 Tax=Flavobacterium bernardetii TaxID=2813823 RepID=A0ABR7IYW8_9FLAO|nr:ChaN family lipoprotein [Flavobacterium bernardetii]MBC5834971.1 ChaN family lipoprotein [Flavobacterium bernardetii]NHF70476.1 ChaN family lipoprotein [Flavobacterium bernardetii]
MKKIVLIVTTFFCGVLNAQEKAPYKIYDRVGQEISYNKMLSLTNKSDVVLFGEMHDNSIIHWLQLELTKDLAQKKNLVLGAEMFEADNQDELNDYLSGKINQKQLDTTARLWKNYRTDYKPLVEFAKEKKFNFIATNIPRKFASLVYKKSFVALDSLSTEQKSWIAPLPIAYDAELPGYKAMLDMGDGHSNENLPKAQAAKDATMAYFICKNLKPETTFIHYNGTYHSDNFEGINWYLKKYVPKVKIVTIATVEQDDILRFEKENQNKADIIIVVDKDVTKTH